MMSSRPEHGPTPEKTSPSAERETAYVHVRHALYDEWKKHGKHYEEYASEFFGTALLMLWLVLVVTLGSAPTSPLLHAWPPFPGRLFLMGLLIGGCGALITISPPGKLSGAHLNPALSAGFWMLGKMHVKDLIGYAVSQMTGGVLGVYLAQVAFGALASQVHDGALAPGPQALPMGVFLAEAAATFVYFSALFVCVSLPRVARWTPLVSALFISVIVGVDGSFSGAGMNPARWFGPALIAPHWELAWAYLTAPFAGGLLAVGAMRLRLLPHDIQTAKLFHDSCYRSLFKHEAMPSTPPDAVRADG
jgi:aquaporin Z